jgi:hypothetical protein
MQTIILKDFSERVFGSVNSRGAWELIEEICADEFECQPEAVTLVESDDGEEIIHIDGEPKARLTYRWPR